MHDPHFLKGTKSFHDTDFYPIISLPPNIGDKNSLCDFFAITEDQGYLQALTKSMNMDICVVGTLNQLFIRDSCTQIFKENEVVSENTPFFVIGVFCTLHSICYNSGF